MVEVKSKIPEDKVELPPITIENVVYFNRHSKELEGSQVRKALLLVQYDCIKYHKESKCFVVGPLNTQDFFVNSYFKGMITIGDLTEEQFIIFKKIPYVKDYNNSDYLLERINGKWTCNCQAFVTKKNKGELIDGVPACSHLLALSYSFSISRFKKEKK